MLSERLRKQKGFFSCFVKHQGQKNNQKQFKNIAIYYTSINLKNADSSNI